VDPVDTANNLCEAVEALQQAAVACEMHAFKAVCKDMIATVCCRAFCTCCKLESAERYIVNRERRGVLWVLLHVRRRWADAEHNPIARYASCRVCYRRNLQVRMAQST
jgi:hypothetical protein